MICGRGNGSHVCALTTARVCAQSLLCIAVSDSNEIYIRDAQTAKPYGTALSGLSSPARYLLVVTVSSHCSCFVKLSLISGDSRGWKIKYC